MHHATLRSLTWIAFAWLAVLLARTAWVSDDAYISFRTADNIVNGYGPVWNTAERAQAYTHPLWLGVFTAAYAITREPFYTAIFLGIAMSLAAVLWLCRCASSAGAFLVALIALLSSKAFIDFSTSGLENALSHLALMGFLAAWWNWNGSTRAIRWLALGAALGALTRLDLALLVAPALAVRVWQTGFRQSLAPLMLGASALVLWECFSLFYYGSLVPNTALAKLNIADALLPTLQSGLIYFSRTAGSDPATLVVIALSFAFVLLWRRQDWPLLAGVALYLLYVLRIGGDFMVGRFFTAPFFVAAALLTRVDAFANSRRAGFWAASIVAIGLIAPWEPALLSGYGYVTFDNAVRGRGNAGPRDNYDYLTVNNIIDERRYYYDAAGLLMRLREGRPEHSWVDDGLALRQGGRQVVVRNNIGFTGFFAGPEVHIVDIYALPDPFLARLTAPAGSRRGHHRRDIPDGYLESLASGRNLIVDAKAAALYERVRLATQAPLSAPGRLRAIVDLLLSSD